MPGMHGGLVTPGPGMPEMHGGLAAPHGARPGTPGMYGGLAALHGAAPGAHSEIMSLQCWRVFFLFVVIVFD